jgi:hypothetical protein
VQVKKEGKGLRLGWPERSNVASLDYLHGRNNESPMIHEDCQAKLCLFDLALLAADACADRPQQLVGTFRNLAHEYSMHDKIVDKIELNYGEWFWNLSFARSSKYCRTRRDANKAG